MTTKLSSDAAPVGKPARPARLARSARRAFTLVEAVLVVAIIIVLTGLLFVAVGQSIKLARRTVEQQFVRSLKVAVDQFKQQYGFLPPLLNDAQPLDETANRVRLVAVNGTEANDLLEFARFLRYEKPPASAARYSTRALPVYLLGGLGKQIGGTDQPGFGQPAADGTFDRAGKKSAPLFDTSSSSERLQRTATTDPGEFRDRWGRAIRFYRWTPTLHTDRDPPPDCLYPFPPTPPGNVAGRKGEVRSYNVPPAVGDPAEEQGLRSAAYAIVSAGADGLFGDEPIDNLRSLMGLDASVPEAEVRRRARLDNHVEFGS